MIYCRELDTKFESSKEMIKALVKKNDDIISFKKAQIFKSCEKGISICSRPIDIIKFDSEATKADFNTDDFYNIVVNSTYILDSHQDLHLKGIWNKTIKDQQGKNYLIADHDLSLDKVIARKENVKMSIKEIPFSAIGKDYIGDTQALIYTTRKDKIINKTAKEWLDSGDSIEASVRMRYVDLDFAVKSDAKEDKKYRENYEKWLPLIANKGDFNEEILYFWGIKQAVNRMESSLVLYGSNNATGLIIQPSQDTGEKHKEPQSSTLDYDYLINNLKF
jgi:hypothetical protein